MSILLKHILRNIRENKFRSILIVFSLTVSTMVLFLNLTIKDDIGNKYTSILRGGYQDYDIVVQKKNVSQIESESYYNSTELNLDGIKVQDTLDLVYASGIYEYDNESIDVTFCACDKKKFVDNKLAVISEKSSHYDENDSNQIIISKKNAKKYNISLDDQMTIDTQVGKKTLTVTAFAETNGHFLVEDNSVMIITDLNTGYELAKSDGKVYSTYINLEDNANVKEMISKFADNNDGFDARAAVDEDSIQEAVDMINNLLTIVLVGVIILNFYVISSITKLIMATRIPVVGTFRSVGATKRKMNFILILENATYGVIGSIFGIIFGILLREPISAIFINAGDAFDYIKIKYEMKPSYIIISVGFSVLLQIAISLSSILKTSKKPIKDTIFNTLSTTAKISKKKTVIGTLMIILSVTCYFMNDKYNMMYAGLGIITGIAGTVCLIPIFIIVLSKILSKINALIFGPCAELGTKTLHKSKTTRSSIVLVSVSISIMMLIYMTVLSVNDIFNKARDTFDCNLRISSLDKTEEEYDFIKNRKDVSKVIFNYEFYANYKLNGKEKTFDVYGTNQFDSGMKGKQSDIENLANDEIIVDEYYANKNNIKIGDKITIDNDYMLAHDRKYTVKGFMNSSEYTTMRNMMVVNKKEFLNSYSKIPASMSIYTSKDADEMKTSLKKELAGTNAYIETQKEFIDKQEASVNSVLSMVQAMLGLSVILSILGLMNNQIIGFIQKKKEYAVLYSTSMSKSQLRKMVLFEVLGTFVCGCLIGTGLSLWLLRLLEQVLYAMGICVDISIKWKQLGMTVLGIFVVLSLTALSPMRKISKINVVEEIKYE